MSTYMKYMKTQLIRLRIIFYASIINFYFGWQKKCCIFPDEVMLYENNMTLLHKS